MMLRELMEDPEFAERKILQDGTDYCLQGRSGTGGPALQYSREST